MENSDLSNKDKNLLLSDLAIHYESQRGNFESADVITKMEEIVDILIESIPLVSKVQSMMTESSVASQKDLPKL